MGSVGGVARCENCGLRLEDPSATLCPSCAYRRKKDAQRAAEAERAGKAPAAPEAVAKPDLDALRERLRLVEETLKEPPPG